MFHASHSTRVHPGKGVTLEWDIPRYESFNGDARDVSQGDPPPTQQDLEYGEQFLIHVKDDDGVDHYYWIYGGISEDYPIEEVIDDLADRYGFEAG